MENNESDKVLEGEIVDKEQEESAALPTQQDPRAAVPAKAKPANGWIEPLLAIGGGLLNWLISVAQSRPSDAGKRAGKQSGRGQMRRRRGKSG